jgi:adenylate kinase
MIFIMFGAPASGKGTNSANISKDFAIPSISTGDLLRAEERENSAIWKQAKPIMDAGGLVPDEIMLPLLGKRIEGEDCRGGFILDGFPRTIEQKNALDDILQTAGMKIDAVIQLNVDQEVLMARNQLRVAESMAAGQAVRSDDNPEVFRTRLEKYAERTAPVLELYRADGVKIHVVNANGEKPETAAAVMSAVKPLSTNNAENLQGMREKSKSTITPVKDINL